MQSAQIVNSVQDRGFAIVEEVLDEQAVRSLIRAAESVRESDSSLRMRGGIFAVRNLLSVSPEIANLAQSEVVRKLVSPILGADFLVVRGLLFDKVPEANWKVPWHQDVTIAVKAKVEAEGFGPWSKKSGVLHVQPPDSVLKSMISVRLHLDPCGEANGPLRVVPGSHSYGRIAEDLIPAHREKFSEYVCTVGRGGALLMRPLLLHASSPSQAAGHRRVIHLDFAAAQLPQGIQWETELTA